MIFKKSYAFTMSMLGIKNYYKTVIPNVYITTGRFNKFSSESRADIFGYKISKYKMESCCGMFIGMG